MYRGTRPGAGWHAHGYLDVALFVLRGRGVRKVVLRKPQWLFAVSTFRARQITPEGELAIHRHERLRPADGRRLSEEELRALDVADLGLPGRVTSTLRSARIVTVGDLLERTGNDLMRIYSLGHISLRQIRRCLAARGLRLRRGTWGTRNERIVRLVDDHRGSRSTSTEEDDPAVHKEEPEPEGSP